MKDEQAGEVPVAFVVKLKNSEATEDEIKQFISKQVSVFFFLNKFEFYFLKLLSASYNFF